MREQGGATGGPGDAAPAGSFAAATAVTARRSEPGRYDVAVDPGWTIVGKPHGGYLLVLLARAAAAALADRGRDHPHPLAVSAHFLAAPDPGPAEVVVAVLRAGRSASQVRARLEQAGHPRVEALLTLTRFDPEAQPWWSDVTPVVVPDAERCARIPATGAGQPDRLLFDRVVALVDPAGLGFAIGRPGGTAELRGWLALADGTTPDPLVALLAGDAFPPATFDLGSIGWVPTLELTGYLRALPAPGLLRVRQRARHVEGGFVDEVCHVWDSRGRLVAEVTQLAAVRVPEAPAGTAGPRRGGPPGRSDGDGQSAGGGPSAATS